MAFVLQIEDKKYVPVALVTLKLSNKEGDIKVETYYSGQNILVTINDPWREGYAQQYADEATELLSKRGINCKILDSGGFEKTDEFFEKYIESRTRELERKDLIDFLKELEKREFSIVKIDPPYKKSLISRIKHRDCVIRASDLESQLKSGKPTPSGITLDSNKSLVYIKAPMPDYCGNYKVSVATYSVDGSRKYAQFSVVIPENLMKFLK